MKRVNDTVKSQVLQVARARGAVTGRDLEEVGLPRQYLYRLYKQGVLERVGRGVYVLAGADVTEHHTLVEATRRVPRGVVCLLSALRFHDLTTQSPFEVWLAVETNAWVSEPEPIPIRFIYMSGAAFTYGIETHEIEGVDVNIYGAAKTVADCFKYRNKVGLDVAIEALRDYRRSDDFKADTLWQAAKVCRISTVIRPYLEAIA